MARTDKLTHVDASGTARMVDVSDKPTTRREAVAEARIRLRPETVQLIRDNAVKKGDVLGVARLAGILGAKRTAELIPLCHPLPLTRVDVRAELDDAWPGVVLQAEVRCVGQTGVEMEALTAVSIAALTVYDMVKAVDREAEIGPIRLLEKRGGASGDYERPG